MIIILQLLEKVNQSEYQDKPMQIDFMYSLCYNIITKITHYRGDYNV